MYIVGIDIGTTSICGVVADIENGTVIKSQTLKNDSFIKSDFGYEKIQDTNIIMRTVTALLENLVCENVAAIGFSGQMHGIVYTDEGGNAVSPLYTWQDERGGAEYQNGVSYAKHLGCYVGYGLATDLYNEKNNLIPENVKYLCTVADYAVMKLCGLCEPLMHITNAASLGCFDVEKECFTLSNPRLPKVTHDFVPIGKYKNIPVCVAVGDNQASFIGSVSKKDYALLNIGTGSQISWLTEKPVYAHGIETRPFDGKTYLAVGCALCGGRAFAMVERFFRQTAELVTGEKIENIYPQIDKILESKKETTLSADCRFCGTRNDPDIRGGIFNISENNFTPADLAFSVLYGMSDELYKMYKNAGGKTHELVCSGNGIRKNAALQKIVSDMFECRIKFPALKEEASFGAALAASVACKINKDIFDACKVIRYF